MSSSDEEIKPQERNRIRKCQNNKQMSYSDDEDDEDNQEDQYDFNDNFIDDNEDDEMMDD